MIIVGQINQRTCDLFGAAMFGKHTGQAEARGGDECFQVGLVELVHFQAVLYPPLTRRLQKC